MAKRIVVVHTSPRVGGNSSMLADEFIRGAKEAGNNVVRIDVGNAKIAGCTGCEYCFKHDGECCQNDDMQALYPILRECDVLVYATPMYCYNMPSQMRAFEDRMFCGIAKPFGITDTALLLCFEDKDITTADPAIATFYQSAKYCGRNVIGKVVVNNVFEKGAIAGNPGLQEAYELGKSISQKQEKTQSSKLLNWVKSWSQ